MFCYGLSPWSRLQLSLASGAYILSLWFDNSKIKTTRSLQILLAYGVQVLPAIPRIIETVIIAEF